MSLLMMDIILLLLNKKKEVKGNFRSILPFYKILEGKNGERRLLNELITFKDFGDYSVCSTLICLSDMKISEEELKIEFSIPEKSHIKVSLGFLEEHASKGEFVIKKDEYE